MHFSQCELTVDDDYLKGKAKVRVELSLWLRPLKRIGRMQNTSHS